MPQIPYGGGLEPLPAGEYRAVCINTFLHESEYEGKTQLRLLIVWRIPAASEGEDPREIWQFTNGRYNPRRKDNSMTQLMTQLCGRELTEPEIQAFDTDYLIGQKATLRLDTKVNSKGNTVQDFREVKPKELQTIESMRTAWEVSKPKGERPEGYDNGVAIIGETVGGGNVPAAAGAGAKSNDEW